MDLGSFMISTRWANSLLIPAVLVAPALQAQNTPEETYQGENPDHYAAIKVLEGEATIRKGDVVETLSRGIPVTEGDVVESRGRGVLQLSEGTRVAFGPGTRFQVAALFREQDADHQVVLRLDQGRLRIALGRESDAQVRVDTPSGRAFLSNGANAGFDVEPDRTVRVKTLSGRVTFRNERDQASILAGERLTVYSDQDRLNRIQDFSTYSGDAFDSWSDRALDVRPGPSWQYLPPEIRYYSDELDGYGEWIWVDEFHSWCWRPLRIAPEWRPYWRGRWGAYPGGMTWISEDPWGFVTCHYGRWNWSVGVGWFWVPGIYYAPAWVVWETSGSYFGWAPIGYYGLPASWGYGPWSGGYCWNIVEINFIHEHHLHAHTFDHPEIFRFTPPGGNRTLSPPWVQGPLMISQGEFQHPVQMQQILRQPLAVRERARVYERQVGRPLFRAPQPGRPPLESSRPTPPSVYRYEAVQPRPNRPLAPPVMIPQRNQPPAAPGPPRYPYNAGRPQPPAAPPPGGRPPEPPGQSAAPNSGSAPLWIPRKRPLDRP